MNLFKKNLELLRKSQPSIALRVEREVEQTTIRVIRSKDGYPIPQVGHISMHSNYYPVEEASRLIIEFKANENNGLLGDRFKQLIREYLLKNQEAQDGHIYEKIIQLVEKQLYEITLEKHSGKQVSVSKALGINRNTLKRKIDAMNIEIKKNRPDDYP